jgi:2-C-methyl-D-erythritol 4-phosphate cytidylyltransferase
MAAHPSTEATDPCAIVPLPRTVDPAAVFTSVASEPALVRIVRSLLEQVAGARVVVSTAPTLAADVRDCLSSAELATVAVVEACEPGSRRQALIAGLEYLGVQAHSSLPVLIGDHRHPLSTGAVAALVIAGLRAGHDDVVVPALAMTDTVKTVDAVGSVLSTIDRSALRTVQYPRGFTAAALWDLLSGTAPEDEDELVSAMRAGLTIGTVDGDANAFQVDLPDDAALLDAIIACRS